MNLLMGTSGWSYNEWIGPFYDKKQGMFTQYTKVFRTTEINSTFYSYPTERLVLGWARYSPPGFVFAAKLPKVITHEKWLRLEEGVEDDVSRFIQLMQPLAEKLGPLLVQLRPMFDYDEGIGDLERFLDILPKNHEWVVEFRNQSWMRKETYDVLQKHNTAYAIVDEPLLPGATHVTADFSYIRWHGHGKKIWYDYDYNEKELEDWVPKVNQVREKVNRTYGYFNNHFSANAVKNAVELLKKLNEATPEQNTALNKVISFRSQVSRPRSVQPLTSFQQSDEGLSVADLLIRFTDSVRLARGEEIMPEIRVTQSSDSLIKASYKSYLLEVDLENRLIRHDCDDWVKGADKKRLCKHLDALFLKLPAKHAGAILERIWEEWEDWSFE